MDCFGEYPIGMNIKNMMRVLRHHVRFNGYYKTTQFDARNIPHVEVGTILAHISFSIYTILCTAYQTYQNSSYRYNIKDTLKRFIGMVDDAPKDFHPVDRMTRALDIIDDAREVYPLCDLVTEDVKKLDMYFERTWGIRMINEDEHDNYEC